MTKAAIQVGGVLVSAETEARLRLHVSELVRWNGAINLVSKATLPDAWTRHVEDSVQLVPFAPSGITHWVDLGSGAGFPGLVVAILLAEIAPEARVTLIESDRRKAAFLRETARMLGLATGVLAERAETVTPQKADVVSARALAPLVKLIPLAARHLRANGVALFLKGANLAEELATAGPAWSFSAERFPSRTDPAAEILRLKGLNHV